MRLITLNCWGGKIYEPLMAFIDAQKSDTDLFCFQEVFSSAERETSHGARMNLFEELQRSLSEYHGFFFPVMKNRDFIEPVDFDVQFGLAIFLRKTITVDASGDEIVSLKRYEWREDADKFLDIARNVAFVSFSHLGVPYTIFNFHGLCSKTKTDSAERTEQSRAILRVMNRFSGSKHLLCGDFNFAPDTQCMAMLEDGMTNLIKTHHILTTRNALFPWPDQFADYILITPDVTEHHFEVISNEISDHLPLVLEFD